MNQWMGVMYFTGTGTTVPLAGIIGDPIRLKRNIRQPITSRHAVVKIALSERVLIF